MEIWTQRGKDLPYSCVIMATRIYPQMRAIGSEKRITARKIIARRSIRMTVSKSIFPRAKKYRPRS